jgi:uncharacterized cupredoxin-like copper-binding protein
MKAKWTTLLLLLVAAALTAAGCGSSNKKSSSDSSSSSAPAASAPAPTTSTSTSSDSGGASAGGGETVKLSADPSGQLKFDKTTLSAKAGTVTLQMDNPSSVPHGVAVEGNGVDKDGKVVQQGGKSTVTVDLKPGKYSYYCPVPGHKQAGMTGTLTVK